MPHTIKNLFAYLVVVLTIILSIGLVVFVPTVVVAADCPTLSAGDLFKVPNNNAVYLLNANMQRMYFPHSTVYKSWYEDYSAVVEIPNTCVDNYPAPSAPPYGVNYRPGSKLIKVQISPSVYVVETGNRKSKIGSEAVARALYGENWSSKVVDVADVFWPNYISSGRDVATAVPHEGMLIKTAESSDVYYVKDGLNYKVLGDARGDVQTVSKSVFDSVSKANGSYTSLNIYSNPAQISAEDTDTVVDEIQEEVVEELASSVRLTTAIGDSINPSVVFNGTNFGIVWEDARDNSTGSDLYFAVVDSAGNKVVADKKITNTSNLFSTNPDIVWNGVDYAVIYAEYSDGVAAGEKINFIRVSASGSVVGNVVELAAGVTKPHPSMAWNGTGYGIVYRTPNNQQGKHYFAYVNSIGEVEKYPVKIIEDQGSDETEIVWDGEMFSIIYRQSPEIIAYGDSISWTVGTYLYRVDKNGNAESPVKFIHGKEALASIWTGSRYATMEQTKTFSVFNKSAAISIGNSQISTVDLTASDLAYNNGDYGFVGVNNNKIYFSEAGSDGVVKQSSVILDETVSTVQSNPTISTDNSSYIIVWSDTRDVNGGSELYFKKMDSL